MGGTSPGLNVIQVVFIQPTGDFRDDTCHGVQDVFFAVGFIWLVLTSESVSRGKVIVGAVKLVTDRHEFVHDNFDVRRAVPVLVPALLGVGVDRDCFFPDCLLVRTEPNFRNSDRIPSLVCECAFGGHADIVFSRDFGGLGGGFFRDVLNQINNF